MIFDVNDPNCPIPCVCRDADGVEIHFATWCDTESGLVEQLVKGPEGKFLIDRVGKKAIRERKLYPAPLTVTPLKSATEPDLAIDCSRFPQAVADVRADGFQKTKALTPAEMTDAVARLTDFFNEYLDTMPEPLRSMTRAVWLVHFMPVTGIILPDEPDVDEPIIR